MRPRGFDTEDVIGRALETFWAKGYEATSIDDLCVAMGIARSSLYHAFGSKHDLLDSALDAYAARSAEWIATLFDEARPVQVALAEFFRRFIDEAVSSNGGKGCFIGNMAAELSRSSEGDARRVRAKMELLENTLATALEEAKGRGEIAPEKDTRALSRYLFATAQGLRLVGKARPDRTLLQSVADTALTCFD